MDKLPVGQLPDLQQSNNDDEIMVITNSEYNQLKKEKISDLITDFTSTNENNALTKGTDGKMFVTDFGNASNITEGTLPTSVLPEIPLEKIPDIPKDKLPQIETDDLPDSGITAGTYTYPTDIVVNSKGQVTSITEGQAGANNANQDLSNLGPLGLDKLNQSKALETGSVSSDADVYADVLKYKNSGTRTGIDTIKPDNYEVVGSPTISEDGVASGFSDTSYIMIPNLNISGVRDFELFTPIFKVNKIASGINQIQNWSLYNDTRLNTYVRANGAFECSIFQGSTIIVSNTIIEPNASYNTPYQVKFSYKNSVWNVYYKKGDGDWIQKVADRADDTGVTINGARPLGWQNAGQHLQSGSIDLNAYKIYVDGQLVYQPCLKIPYTLSKTGSKIVDVAYRDRVQDMYEQYGYAPYYTIDEENENFTLPMGEIYGMIAQNKTFDGFSLFDTKLTDRILTGDEALGWALQGSLVTMTYPDAVNRIKELYTAGTDTTYRGISCKKTTDGRYIADISQKTAIDTLYSKTGIADFYILDSANNQFYLPKNKWFMQLTADTDTLNQYNESALPNITGSFNATELHDGEAVGYGAFIAGGSDTKGTPQSAADASQSGFSFDASRSSSVYKTGQKYVQPPSSNKLLYYKVGHTVTNSGSIDVANVLSDINLLETNKADKDLSNCTKPYVTETYQNGASWYRVWSDGWCEQGGLLPSVTSRQDVTVTFLKTFSNTNYNIFKNVATDDDSGTSFRGVSFFDKQTSQADTYATPGGSGIATWEAHGFI